MLHVCSAFSGDTIAVVNFEEVEGKSTEALKEHLAPIIGVSKFQQRLTLDNNDIPSCDVSLINQKVQLVVLQFGEPDAKSERKMIAACIRDDVQTLQAFLEEPRDPNLTINFTKDFKGLCLIHIATRYGCGQCVRLLLEASADQDSQEAHKSQTPLHIAAQLGHVEVVRILIEAGSGMDRPGQESKKPEDQKEFYECEKHVKARARREEEAKKGRKEERKKGRKEERKKGRKEERKKGRKEERKKGRKEGRKEARKEGRKKLESEETKKRRSVEMKKGRTAERKKEGTKKLESEETKKRRNEEMRKR